ncbi:MAG: ATP-dependent 6-phosphofructokinase [Planctomycetota bacterium]
MKAESPQQCLVARLGPARLKSPLPLSTVVGDGLGDFVLEDTWIRYNIEVSPGDSAIPDLLFEKAGPREHIFFAPAETKAAIVTCGGLCPGLNTVIRSLFLELHHNYGVADVVGIRFGYRGLNPAHGHPPVRLTPSAVEGIDSQGGTILGTSRGSEDPAVMVDFLLREHIDILFCAGGDGTLRGAHALQEEISRRGVAIAVIGIPKTIDNDVAFCSRTFGFSTALQMARGVLACAHTEATSALNGIGLVKLMGRDAGFVAAGATLASQEVNFTLIPEVPFDLEGEHGFLRALEKRLEARGHALIVVAEGTGQSLFQAEREERDASGNPRYHDVGLLLKQEISDHLRSTGMPFDLKYVDPSYIIRSVAANTDDNILCDQFARCAVHAAMAGCTDTMIGFANGALFLTPLTLVTTEKKRIDPESDFWRSVLATTGQPARMRT